MQTTRNSPFRRKFPVESIELDLCRSLVPLGGRVLLKISSGRLVGRTMFSHGLLGRGGLGGIWVLAPHLRSLTHGGIQGAEGTRVSVGRSVNLSGEAVGLRCPEEDQGGAWSDAPDITHRLLAPWPMAIALGQGMSWFAGVFIISYGRVGLGRFGYGTGAAGMFGYVRVCLVDQVFIWATPSQGHLTLIFNPCRRPAIGAIIRRRLT